MRLTALRTGLGNLLSHGVALAKELAGARGQYCIRGAYRHRTESLAFDDTGFTDEYQKEVYERAAEIARQGNHRTVYDVGCGSGFKLVRYLGEFDTVGFDVPRTVDFLRRTYPTRRWEDAGALDATRPPADLVICSDVIEHVSDPDQLMRLLLTLSRRWLVLSTPDRRRQYPGFSRHQLGPPESEHHVREWSMREFLRYVDQFADIKEHCHSNPAHATQLIVATKRC